MTRFFRLAAAFIVLPGAVFSQDSQEVVLVKSVFATLNPVSITENREYCGYIGYTIDGVLIASTPTEGEEGSCLSDDPKEIALIVASYHTHGAYSPNYYNEVPSGDDIEGDVDEGIDGYVATPGGRLWYIDTNDEEISQICGLRCLPHDPGFVPGDLGIIAQSYRFDDLITLLTE